MANELSIPVKKSVSFGNVTIGGTDIAVPANHGQAFQQTIPAGTNTLVNFACTVAVAGIQAIQSTTAATLYTNAASTGSPTQTIAMGAGKQIIWNTGDLAAGKVFTADVTALYITNVADTILRIIVCDDATPTVSG